MLPATIWLIGHCINSPWASQGPGQSYGHVTGSSGDYDFMLVKSLGTSKITGGLAATSA